MAEKNAWEYAKKNKSFMEKCKEARKKAIEEKGYMGCAHCNPWDGSCMGKHGGECLRPRYECNDFEEISLEDFVLHWG